MLKIITFISQLVAVSLVLLILSYFFLKLINFSTEKGREQAVKVYNIYSQNNTKSDQKSLFSKMKTYYIDKV